jgi:hypothetical protein
MIRWKHYFIIFLFLIFTVTAADFVRGQHASPVYVGPPVVIPASHGDCGIYFYQAFNATAGEVLTSSVSANSSVDIYVMTTAGFDEWQHQVLGGGDCTPLNSVASQINTTNYSIDVKIPVTGTYYLVVNNLSYSTVTAKISANVT